MSSPHLHPVPSEPLTPATRQSSTSSKITHLSRWSPLPETYHVISYPPLNPPVSTTVACQWSTYCPRTVTIPSIVFPSSISTTIDDPLAYFITNFTQPLSPSTD
ncbi:hypothetical protein BGW80DRAFT_1325499 [Lactifluus volemus]|nr:hypothetical protein BGW80DRAFT_1325499 [Lactifluus volemus]